MRLWHAEVTLCFLPPGRATEPAAPVQTSPHARRGQDEGVRAHDAVPGVVGGRQALRPPAPPGQHDHGERQDQHHGAPPRPGAPAPGPRLPSTVPQSIARPDGVPPAGGELGAHPAGRPLPAAASARALASPARPEALTQRDPTLSLCNSRRCLPLTAAAEYSRWAVVMRGLILYFAFSVMK